MAFVAIGVKFLRPSTPTGLKSFSGGLNSTDNPLALNDSESSDLFNIDFDINGSFKKRNGYRALNTSAFNSGATCTSLHYFKTSSVENIMGTFGNKLAKQDSFDGTWDDITGALTITAGNGNLFTWRNFNAKAYGTNNVNAPLKWDGSGNATAWTMPTNVTLAKFCEVFNNYMFIGNILLSGARKQTRVYWSSLNEAETWDATDFNEIGLEDGQPITGLKSLGDRLVIFKENSIHIATFTGDSDIPFVFDKTQSHVGCISGYSIQEVSNGLIFLAQDGIYFFDGNNSQKLSDRITTTLKTFVASRYSVSASGYQKEKNKYWLSFTASGGSTNNRVITFDAFNNAFSLYKGMAVNAFTTLITSGEERIYFGDYSGYAYRLDQDGDDYPANSVTAIDAYLYTKWFDFNDTANQKAIPNVVVYYEYSDSTLTFSYSYDLNTGDDYTQTFSTEAPGSMWDSAIFDSSVWGSEGGSLQRRDLDGRGRLVRLKFANMTVGETFQINGIGTNFHLETDV